MIHLRHNRNIRERGTTLIEFALVALLCCLLLLAFVEFGRMILVYTTVANSARTGARYAITHGGTRNAGATGMDAPCGPGNNPPNVVTVVKNFASAGLLDTSRLTINVTYTSGSNAPGSKVDVKVVYPYDPLSGYFPLRVRLGSISEGVITF